MKKSASRFLILAAFLAGQSIHAETSSGDDASSALLHSQVEVTTNLGTFTLQLRGDVAPKTVANFLNYLNTGAYDNSFFHRSVPGFIVQGGGFGLAQTPTGFDIVNIESNPPVENEFELSNLRGTVAMAKLGNDPNSATNQWFVNLANNSANLNNQNGGFTVFAEVVGDGMAVVDAIAALPVWQFNDPFGSLPLINYDDSANPQYQNFVRVESMNLLFTPPAIVSQPVNAQVVEGTAATFEVTAGGTALTYQWELSTDGGLAWSPLPGATGRVYSTGPTTLSMDGHRYRVELSNDLATALSAAAVLSVAPGPVFSPAEMLQFAVGTEVAGYQFVSSDRFQINEQAGTWNYTKITFETGRFTFTYDDGSEETLDLVFTSPASATSNGNAIDLRRDFFGLPVSSQPARSSFWLGNFDQRHFKAENNLGWILHGEHQWLYATGRGYQAGMWLWDNIQQDWLWTRPGVHPFFFSNQRNAWLYYQTGGEPAKRLFYSYEAGEAGEEIGWLTVPPAS
jgi:cyclophilin family peptidyl-prolyl cis-trans isomerase